MPVHQPRFLRQLWEVGRRRSDDAEMPTGPLCFLTRLRPLCLSLLMPLPSICLLTPGLGVGMMQFAALSP